MAPGMQKFVIERVIPGAGNLTDAELRAISLKALETLDHLGPSIKWLHSYVTDDKVYCVYLAADASIIQEHSDRSGIPANRISPVRHQLGPTVGSDPEE
jgi:hypothetical protein